MLIIFPLRVRQTHVAAEVHFVDAMLHDVVSFPVYCFFIVFASDRSVTRTNGSRPEVAILGADQKERGLWGREWDGYRSFRLRIHCACPAVFEMSELVAVCGVCYGVALQRKLVSIVDRPETLFCFAQSTFVITRQLGLLKLSLIAYV